MGAQASARTMAVYKCLCGYESTAAPAFHKHLSSFKGKHHRPSLSLEKRVVCCKAGFHTRAPTSVSFPSGSLAYYLLIMH